MYGDTEENDIGSHEMGVQREEAALVCSEKLENAAVQQDDSTCSVLFHRFETFSLRNSIKSRPAALRHQHGANI